jgi:hypothetical protein
MHEAMMKTIVKNMKDPQRKKYPAMTRQHFQFIADVIRESNPPFKGTSKQIIREQMAEEFANELAGTNPNFDRVRFMAACQPTQENK